MNQQYAKFLILLFFWAVGTFSIVRGVVSIRLRSENTFIGWLRVVLGSLMVLVPLALLYYLRGGTS